jgi:RNA polymerase sigma-70 factor (sigma-E family)
VDGPGAVTTLPADEVRTLPVDRRAAVTALFHSHSRSLVRLAALLVDDPETAEDVVQEAYISLYRHWPRVRDPGAALGYLRTATLNLSRTRIRRRIRERLFTMDEPQPVAPADTGALGRDATETVMRALAQLPRRQREVVVLRYYEDLSEAQIATALGITPGSVKQHASRALAALSRRLEAST